MKQLNASPVADELEFQRRLYEKEQHKLCYLEEQEAKFGTGVPLHIVNDLTDTRERIKVISSRLQELEKTSVDDNTNRRIKKLLAQKKTSYTFTFILAILFGLSSIYQASKDYTYGTVVREPNNNNVYCEPIGDFKTANYYFGNNIQVEIHSDIPREVTIRRVSRALGESYFKLDAGDCATMNISPGEYIVTTNPVPVDPPYVTDLMITENRSLIRLSINKNGFECGFMTEDAVEQCKS